MGVFMCIRKSISDSENILQQQALTIGNVTEWANAMGYTRSHFCRIFKKEFGEAPKEYLKRFRFRAIKEEIKKDYYACGIKIAINSGFNNEKALDKYLSYHFNTNLTAIRNEIIKKAHIGDKK